jgi:molybdate transport system substrate-binding protein
MRSRASDRCTADDNRRMTRGLVLLCALLVPWAVRAETIKVLTTGAFREVVVALVPKFQAATGVTVQVDEGTAGALTKRVDGGEGFDVLVLTSAALKRYAERGVVATASATPLAKVGIGVAVRAGTPAPAIRTVEQFKQALLDARAIAYVDPASGGSSGVYLATLFDRLGIAEQMRAKAVLANGGLVAPRLLTGEADIAIHQISEILVVPNVTLVGPLPAEIQNYTEYAGGIAAGSSQARAAQAFLDLLASPQAGDTMRIKGMLPAH